LLTSLVWWLVLKGVFETFPAQSAVVSNWFGLGPDVEVLIAVAMGSGMISHVLGDSCTDFGTAPLAPVWYWSGHRYVRMGLWTPLRFKVGNEVEEGFIAPLCAAAVGWAVAGVFAGLWTIWAAAGALCGLGWGFLVAAVGKAKAKRIVLGKKRRRRSTRKKKTTRKKRTKARR
jgi:hypothetical protein